ncbi:MAG: hypothetical protein FWE08_02260 [Oscillospiraceae bacterium]|nr:hypothetical protein [Oscillospiraceae bacterium]
MKFLLLILLLLLFAGCQTPDAIGQTTDDITDYSTQTNDDITNDSTSLLLTQLEASGFSFEELWETDASYSNLSVGGRLIRIGNESEREGFFIHEYDSIEAMTMDSALISPDGLSIRQPDYIIHNRDLSIYPTYWFKSDFIIVRYMGESEEIINFLTKHLTFFAGHGHPDQASDVTPNPDRDRVILLLPNATSNRVRVISAGNERAAVEHWNHGWGDGMSASGMFVRAEYIAYSLIPFPFGDDFQIIFDEQPLDNDTYYYFYKLIDGEWIQVLAVYLRGNAEQIFLTHGGSWARETWERVTAESFLDLLEPGEYILDVSAWWGDSEGADSFQNFFRFIK